jgi:hypothetical protein
MLIGSGFKGLGLPASLKLRRTCPTSFLDVTFSYDPTRMVQNSMVATQACIFRHWHSIPGVNI